MNKAVIELQNIKRNFQVGDETVHALRGVSFTIREGEFVTIMGTSGSGKSTLLNTLGCLDTPTSGEYLLDGISVRTMSKPQRAVLRNRKIGFVFQSYNLLPKTTAVENVELPLMYNSSVSASERRRRAIEALQARIQTMQTDHSRQMAEIQQKYRREIADKEAKHKQEISFLKTVIARAAAWFPYFREMLRIENLCRLVGFSDGQTATLVKGKPLEYAGELYSEEHGRKFKTEKAGIQVVKDPTDGTKLVLAIDRKPIAEWFKEQFDKLRQNIHRPMQPQRKGRGMKI